MEFIETLQHVWAVVLKYQWMMILAIIGAGSFIFYRLVDFLQYSHVKSAPKPEDIKMKDDVYSNKRTRKSSRSMKTFWKGTSSWA